MGGWVGGGGGGVNNVPLDIHLHDDLVLLIASTGSRHTDALRLIPVHGSDSPNSASKAMDVK